MRHARTICLLAAIAVATLAHPLDAQPSWEGRGSGPYLFGITPDGRTLITGSEWGYRVWDLPERRPIASVELKGVGTVVRGGAPLSPAGRYLATRNAEGLAIRDFQTGAIVATARGIHPWAATFAPTARLLFVVSDSSAAMLRFPELDTLWRRAGRFMPGFFAGGDSTFVLIDSGGLVRVDARTSERRWHTPLDAAAYHEPIGLADSSRRIVARSPGGYTLFDAASGAVVGTIAARSVTGNTRHLADAGSRHLVTVDSDRSDSALCVYDVVEGRRIRAHALPATMTIGSIWGHARIPGTDRIILTNNTGEHTVIDAMSGEVIDRFPERLTGITKRLAMAADGSLVAQTIHATPVVRASGADGIGRYRMLTPWIETSAMALSPNGNILAVAPDGFNGGGSTVTAGLYDPRRQALVQPITLAPRVITTLAFAGNHRLVTGADNGAVRVHLVQGGTVEATMQHPGTPVSELAVSHDTRTIAAWSSNGPLSVWDRPSGRLRRTFTNLRSLRAFLLTPDGDELIVARHDGRFAIWDIDDSTERHPAGLDSVVVANLALTADGRWLALGASEVVVYDLERETVARRLVDPMVMYRAPGLVAIDSAMRTVVRADGNDVVAWTLDAPGGVADGATATRPIALRTTAAGDVQLDLELERPARVDIQVVDMLGRTLATHEALRLPSGAQSILLGVEPPTGVSLVVVTIDGRSTTLPHLHSD